MSRRGRTGGARSIPVAWLDPVAASPIEVAAGAFILTGLGLIAMIWGAGMASSWLIEGEAADIGVTDAALALVHFGTNWFEWDGAWSESVAESLPGQWWFWFLFAVEVLILSILFWPAWRLLGPRAEDPLPVVIEENPPKHPRAAKHNQERQARTASRRLFAGRGLYPAPITAPAVDKIVTSEAGGHRLILGRRGSNLVATDKYHSVIVFGPTRSGKTSALAAPAILEWDGPVLAISSKSDLVSLAWRDRAQNGQSWLFDPTSSMAKDQPGNKARRPAASHGWSPLHLISAVPQPRNEPEIDRRVQQWGLARQTARWMVGAARTGDAEREMPEPWYVAAEQLLAPMLLAAAAEELPIGEVAAWIERRDRTPVDASLARSGVAEAEAAWDGAHNYDGATTAGSYQILAMIMFPYGDPKVLNQARREDITARHFLDGEPNTLFVLMPPNHQDRLRPLITTLVSEVLDTAIEQATASPTGRLTNPLLVVLDDALAGAPHHLIEQLASLGAGLGIQVLTLVQDLGQIERSFGALNATRLVNNHRANVLLPGISDGATLEYVNSIVSGHRLVRPPANGEAEDGSDPLVVGSATWMRTLHDGDALCVYGNLPPIQMSLRPWYGDEALRERVQPAPPPQSRFRRRRRADQQLVGSGFPNPFDSEGNDREAARYWEAVAKGGELPEPRPFDDGTGRRA